MAIQGGGNRLEVFKEHETDEVRGGEDDRELGRGSQRLHFVGFIFIYFAMLKLNPGSLCMLSRLSTTEQQPSPSGGTFRTHCEMFRFYCKTCIYYELIFCKYQEEI